MVELDYSACVHDQHLVRIHNCVQTVSDRNYSAPVEFISNRALNQRISPEGTDKQQFMNIYNNR